VFLAHHQRHGAGEIDVVYRLLRGIAGANNRNPVFAEPAQHSADIVDRGKRQALRRSGRDLADRWPESRRSVPWYNDRINPGRICGSKAGAKIVRVLDAVKDQEQYRTTVIIREFVFDQGTQCGLIEDGFTFHLDNYALVARLTADLLQSRPVGRLNFDAARLCLRNDRLNPGICRLIFGIKFDDFGSRA